MRALIGHWLAMLRGVRTGFLCWAGISKAEQARRREARALSEEQRKARAAHAEALMADPLLNEAFDAVEAIYIEHWRTTRSDQSAERERLWDAITMLRIVKEHLSAFAIEGALLERDVHALQQARRRI